MLCNNVCSDRERQSSLLLLCENDYNGYQKTIVVVAFVKMTMVVLKMCNAHGLSIENKLNKNPPKN